MQTRNWVLPVIMTAAATAAGSYLLIRHGLVKDMQCDVAQTPSPENSTLEETDRSVNQRKLEGIGSTRDLQPLPIPQGAAR